MCRLVCVFRVAGINRHLRLCSSLMYVVFTWQHCEQIQGYIPWHTHSVP